MKDAAKRDWVEIAATVLLAVAGVATAWSSYQAARWNGEQAKASSANNRTRIQAARAAGLANAQAEIDVATFTQGSMPMLLTGESLRPSTASASAPSSRRPSRPGSQLGRSGIQARR